MVKVISQNSRSRDEQVLSAMDARYKAKRADRG